MLVRFVLLTSICMFHVVPAGAAGTVSPGASLRAAYDEMQAGLHRNPYGKPLHLDSRESSSDLKGDMHAVADHPFGQVRTSLDEVQAWCDVLILHLNTKFCEAQSDGGRDILAVNIGKKHDQPLDKTHQVRFDFRVTSATADYFSVVLNAATGPYGTKNYRILLEAVPLAQGRTFIHLSYSYGFGLTARLAMQTYLGTIGSAKVGFTETGRRKNGGPVYVGGVRGMIERNTMRYFLAIESYLDALSVPADAQVEKRLSGWFAAIERYPRQLHEMEREDYLAMKRREIRRQQG
jgi:hypothetical protein